jgi:hypothetical protein
MKKIISGIIATVMLISVGTNTTFANLENDNILTTYKEKFTIAYDGGNAKATVWQTNYNEISTPTGCIAGYYTADISSVDTNKRHRRPWQYRIKKYGNTVLYSSCQCLG